MPHRTPGTDVANGTVDGPRDKLTGLYTDTEMARRVRALAEREGRSNPVTIRRIEPESVEAAPSEAKGAPAAEQAGPSPVPSPLPPGEGVRPAVPPPATPAARTQPRGETPQVAAWRRDEIVDWIREQGTATIAEVKDHFNLAQTVATSDLNALRTSGRLRRTGSARVGPRGGRPSPEFRTLEPDEPPEPIFSSHAPKGSDEGAQQAANGTPDRSAPVVESPAGTAARTRPEPEHGGTDAEDAAADGREAAAPCPPAYLAGEPFELPVYKHACTPGSDSPASCEEREPEPTGASPGLTVHQELTVRYVRSLIGWIERAQTVREQAPPEHVFDRIERLLGIEDGVA